MPLIISLIFVRKNLYVLYDGLNILSAELSCEMSLFDNCEHQLEAEIEQKQKVNQFLKIGGWKKVVEWFIYKEYVLYKYFVLKFENMVRFK